MENVLKAIDRYLAKWKADANMPDWLANFYILEVGIIAAFFIVLHLVYKLGRSTEVSESGKVSVRYHPPLTWPARYSEKIAGNRARYTVKQKRFLSAMYRGRNRLEAFAVFLLGFILTSAGVFLFVMEPSSIFSKVTAGYLVAGLAFIAVAWWLLSMAKDDDPFNSESED